MIRDVLKASIDSFRKCLQLIIFLKILKNENVQHYYYTKKVNATDVSLKTGWKCMNNWVKSLTILRNMGLIANLIFNTLRRASQCFKIMFLWEFTSFSFESMWEPFIWKPYTWKNCDNGETNFGKCLEQADGDFWNHGYSKVSSAELAGRCYCYMFNKVNYYIDKNNIEDYIG